MPRKKEKTRRLWLNVKQSGAKVKRNAFIKRLIRSIEDGTYRLPDKWRVTLLLRNRESAEMNEGDWQKEMEKSAASSEGWDLAVLSYLKGKLRHGNKRRVR